MIYTAISIIYNPKSAGDSAKNAKKLQADLSKAFPKIQTKLHKTEYAGHAKKLARELAQASSRPLIISSSGDGGYNEVVNGVMYAQPKRAQPICAVLASGNANDHSRSLQNDSLLKTIKTAQLRSIDLLKITIEHSGTRTEQYAHSYIGFGLTPIVATELNKTGLNMFTELLIVLRTFRKYTPFNITHQGDTMKLDSLVFANIDGMAKVLQLSKESKPDDGLFEIVMFRHTNKRKLLGKFVKASLNNPDTPRSSKKYTFSTHKGMSAQLDGEVIQLPKHSSVEITSEHKALTTLL